MCLRMKSSIFVAVQFRRLEEMETRRMDEKKRDLKEQEKEQKYCLVYSSKDIDPKRKTCSALKPTTKMKLTLTLRIICLNHFF